MLNEEDFIKLLKENLTVNVDIKKSWSNYHTITTTVKFGKEVISETVKEECKIGEIPHWQ